MTAPTEAEIREWVVEHGRYPKPEGLAGRLLNIVEEWSNAVDVAAFAALDDEDPRTPEAVAPGAWRDLRPSEAIVLRNLVKAAREHVAEQASTMIVDELTAAGVAFAAQFPDVPWTPLTVAE